MVRFKNRYLVVQMETVDEKTGIIDYAPSASESAPTSSTLATQLRALLQANFGDHAASLASQSFSVKYCNAITGLFILRVAREQLSTIWMTISLAGSARMIMRMVHVAGTIRSAQRAAMKYATKKMETKMKLCSSKDERNKMKQMIEASHKAIKAINA